MRLARHERMQGRLTRILGVFRAYILIACIQDILIHQGRSWRYLPEEADLHRLPNLDPLSFLHEDLPRIFASIFTVQARYTVLFWVVAFFEGLQGRHEIMTASYTGGDDALGDTGSDGAFNDGGDGVHGANDLGLELWGNVEFDLLEEVFGSTKATDDEDVLEVTGLVRAFRWTYTERAYLEDSVLGLNGNDLVAD